MTAWLWLLLELQCTGPSLQRSLIECGFSYNSVYSMDFDISADWL